MLIKNFKYSLLSVLLSGLFAFCHNSGHTLRKNVVSDDQVPIPYSKDSFYKSVIIGALLPVIDNSSEFDRRLKILFGEQKVYIDSNDFAKKIRNIQYLKDKEFQSITNLFLKKHNIRITQSVNDKHKQVLSNKLKFEIHEHLDNDTRYKTFVPQTRSTIFEEEKSASTEDNPQGTQIPRILIYKTKPDLSELPIDNKSTKFIVSLDHYRPSKSKVLTKKIFQYHKSPINLSNSNKYQRQARTSMDISNRVTIIDDQKSQSLSKLESDSHKQQMINKYNRLINEILAVDKSDNNLQKIKKSKAKNKLLDQNQIEFEDYSTSEEKEIAYSFHRLSMMPDCVMKKLKNVYYLLALKNIKKNFKNPSITLKNSTKVSFDNDIVTKTLEKLISEINDHPRGYMVEDILKKAENDLKTSSFKNALDLLYLVKQKLEPLDIEMLRYYNSQTESSTTILKDHYKTILFLGRTGAGKSTTIQYLAGSKMKQQNINGLDHIGFEINKNILSKITTSPEKKSETKYINIVPINSSTNDKILLCDTPGFDDTNGEITDISNTIGIHKALKCPKGVSFALVISYSELSGRATSFRQLLKLIISQTTNFETLRKSFLYLFTKANDKDLKSNIAPQLKSILQNLSNKEKSDDNFTELLYDIYQESLKDNGRTIIVKPLQNDPKMLLNAICNSRFVSRPYKYFKLSFSPKAINTLNYQLDIIYKEILKALENEQYDIIEYYSELLTYIQSIDIFSDQIRLKVKQPFVHLQKTKTLKYNDFKKTILFLDKCTDYQQKDLKYLNKTLLDLESINRILNINTYERISTNTPRSKIQNLIVNIIYQIEIHEITDRNLWIFTNNFNLFINCFDEYKNAHSIIKDIIHNKLNNFSKLANKAIQDDDISDILQKFVSLSEVAKDHKKEDPYGVIKTYDKICSSIISQVKNKAVISSKTLKFLDNYQKSNNYKISSFGPVPLEKTKDMVEAFYIIDSYINKLEKILKIEKKLSVINQIYLNVSLQISNSVEKNLNTILNTSLPNNKPLQSKVITYLNIIKPLRAISKLSPLIDIIYYRLEGILQSKNEELGDELIKMLTNINTNKGFNYDLLYLQLEKIRKVECIDEGMKDEVWDNFYKYMSNHLTNISEQNEDNILELYNLDSLDDYERIISHLKKLEQTKKYLPNRDISQHITNIYIDIYYKISKFLDQLYSQCDISKYDKQTNDIYLSVIKKADSSYDMKVEFNTLTQQSQDLTIENDKLIQEIKDLNNDVATLGEHYNNRKKFTNRSLIKLTNLNENIAKINKSSFFGGIIDSKKSNNIKIKKLLENHNFANIDQLTSKISILQNLMKREELEFNEKKSSLLLKIKEKSQKYTDNNKQIDSNVNRCKFLEKESVIIFDQSKIELKTKAKLDDKSCKYMINEHQYRKGLINKLEEEKKYWLFDFKYYFNDQVKIDEFYQIHSFFKKSKRLINKFPYIKDFTPLIERSEEVEQRFLQYINTYNNFLNQSIQYGYRFLDKIHEQNCQGNIMSKEIISKVNNTVYSLCNSLAKIKDANDNPKYNVELGLYFKRDNLSFVAKKLMQLYNDFENTLISYSSIYINQAVFKNHLNFAKSMRALDEWIPNNQSFREVYVEYQRIFFKLEKLELNTIDKNINTMNFFMLSQQINSIKELIRIDNISKITLGNIQDKLYDFLIDKLKKVNQQIIILEEFDLDMDKIIKLEEYLHKLSKARLLYFKNKDSLFEPQKQKELFFKELNNRRLLYSWFVNFISKINNLVSLQEYRKAENKISKIKIFSKILINRDIDLDVGMNDMEDNEKTDNGNSLFYSITKSIDQLNLLIKENLKREKQKYLEIDLMKVNLIGNPYLSLNPKRFYNNLKEVYSENIIYRETWFEIEKDIRNKILNLIDHNLSSSSTNIDSDRSREIHRFCSTIISDFPDHLYRSLKSSLDNVYKV